MTTTDFTALELEALAMEIEQGSVFCSWQVNGMDQEQLKMIFVPLNEKPLSPLKLAFTPEEGEQVVHVFQRMDASFFKKPNGYPSFKTCYGLKQKYVRPLMRAMEKAREAIEGEELAEKEREAGYRD